MHTTGRTSLTALQQAHLAAAADRLIPGDHDFPVPSATGVAATVASRVSADRLTVLAAGLDRLAAAAPFVAAGAADQVRLLEAAERDDADFFALLREVVYYCYYAQPAVTDTLRRLGHDVNDTPLPRGYAMEPFQPHHLPTHRAGRYVATGQVGSARAHQTGEAAT